MTRDELRFEELTKKPHLWPEEVREVERLAETLGREVKIVRMAIEDVLGMNKSRTQEPA